MRSTPPSLTRLSETTKVLRVPGLTQVLRWSRLFNQPVTGDDTGVVGDRSEVTVSGSGERK